MEYRLAKELKEAGFPQAGEGTWVGPMEKLTWTRSDRVYAPTLSEVIEACGKGFETLQIDKSRSRWVATGPNELLADRNANLLASTPEEAVARLWLALQMRSSRN